MESLRESKQLREKVETASVHIDPRSIADDWIIIRGFSPLVALVQHRGQNEKQIKAGR